MEESFEVQTGYKYISFSTILGLRRTRNDRGGPLTGLSSLYNKKYKFIQKSVLFYCFVFHFSIQLHFFIVKGEGGRLKVPLYHFSRRTS
jgi:hypothetical protein